MLVLPYMPDGPKVIIATNTTAAASIAFSGILVI